MEDLLEDVHDRVDAARHGENERLLIRARIGWSSPAVRHVTELFQIRAGG
jgi:hypothetical protein